MRTANDLSIGGVQSIFWSPDGSMLAVLGRASVMNQQGAPQWGDPLVEVVSPWFRNNGSEALVSVQLGLQGSAQLIGFTPNGNGLITDQREYQLVSGFHRLLFMKTEFTQERAVVHHNEPRIVELDSEETHGYAFAADGKTFRTIAFERDGSGQPKKIDVREVDVVDREDAQVAAEDPLHRAHAFPERQAPRDDRHGRKGGHRRCGPRCRVV